jgi:hypothetical protein
MSLENAASRFQGAVVDASDTGICSRFELHSYQHTHPFQCIDFSDTLTRRRKAMYRTFVKRPTLETSEYEMLPRDLALQETPMQRLRRLQYELQELSEEVEKNRVSRGLGFLSLLYVKLTTPKGRRSDQYRD